MADYGERYADAKIRKVERQLETEYRKAERELKKKLADFVRSNKERDKLKQAQLQAGIITQKEYEDWLKGQVFQKKRWENKIKSVQQVIHNANVEAARIVHENKIDVYNENYYHAAYECEMITGVSFDLYSTDAASRLIKDREKILPEWKIDEPKDYAWNYNKVNSSVLQGIIQGESVDQIMERLADNLATQNKNKMRLFARTAITGAQNAGRQQQMTDAEKRYGIEQLKQWVATLDSRTRDAHRMLDGQEVPIDKPFKSELGDIDYPGDPSADPANVYNCRCTMITIYPEYRTEEDNWRESEEIDGESYQEWKEGKKKQAKGEEKSALEKKIDEIAEKKNPVDFVPAKTIEEAEDFAKSHFVDTNMWASWGVSYDGVSLETANAVNKQLYEFYQKYDVEKFSSIVAPAGNTKLGKRMSNATAGFSPMNRGFILNRKSLKTPEGYEKKQREEKALVKRYIENPSSFTIDSKSAKRILDASAKSGRATVPDNITEAINHELGHALEKTLRRSSDYGTIEANWKTYAEQISGYSTESINEYIAESFCAWQKGEKIPDKVLLKAFKEAERK